MYEIRENEYPQQPRERLLAFGVEKLSDSELLAILLRTGTKNMNVFELSKAILSYFETLEQFRQASVEELIRIPGIGHAKACEIRAMIELGKRIHTSHRKHYGQVIGSRAFGMSLVAEMADLEQENLLAIYLDAQNNIIQKKIVFIGTVNHSLANPREVLNYAIRFNAVNLIIAHNHPSGNLEPSQADRVFTEKMNQSCQIMGINFLDHIIVGRDKYLSFREEKML